MTNDSSNTQVEVPKGVDSQTSDMLERCMATCGKAAGTRAKRRGRRRHQVRKYEDITSSGTPGLTMRFLISLI